jgi:hypothetical protein
MPKSKRNKTETWTYSVKTIKKHYITEAKYPSSLGTIEWMILSITTYDSTHCTSLPEILKRQIQI